MIIFVNEKNEIKDVNATTDESLTPLEITEANPFEGWSIAKICCYKAEVNEGRVTMMTPYVDTRLIEHIDQLSKQTEAVVTDNKLDSVLKQARMDAVNNTDEQALEVKDLYAYWDDIKEGSELVKDTRLNYDTDLYKVLQTHNKQSNWNPKDAPSLFAKVLIPDPEVIPDWEQPSSTNPYMTGDKVKHNGFKWQSLIDNNVWEPTEAVPTLWKNIGPVE